MTFATGTFRWSPDQSSELLHTLLRVNSTSSLLSSGQRLQRLGRKKTEVNAALPARIFARFEAKAESRFSVGGSSSADAARASTADP